MSYSSPKRYEITSWIKEVLSMPIEGEILSTPIKELKLSVRAYNVLSNAGIITVSDFILFGPEKICRVKNAGKKTIHEIGNAILSKVHNNKEKLSPEAQCALFKTDSSNDDIKNANLATRRQTYSSNEIPFVDIINIIFSAIAIKSKYLPIMKARYGYEDGKCRTLEEIGNNIGVTRERVRQIITKAIRRIEHPSRRKALQSLVEPMEELLLRRQGIISINDFAHHEYFASATRNQLKFLMNLFVELYEERYRIIDKQFLTSLNDYEIKVFQYKIRETALKCKYPIDEKALIESVKAYMGNISTDYLIHYLLHKKHAEISDGKVLSPGRLSIPQKVKLLMRTIDKPMHFKEIAKLYKNHYSDKELRTSDLDRAIHTRIGASKDFIIVGPGTFMLRDKFNLPPNIDKIVGTSKKILQEINTISDTKYLINELQKRDIEIENLNEYSLKPLLLEHSGFIKYGKFEIGIDEFLDKYERKPLSYLIFEILSSATKSMHVKTIWNEISKQRGFPKYAVEQKLADVPQFIRVAPATYTVASNIDRYQEKCNIIIDFAKEWINLKGTAISAFFASEVLKATEEIKDLSIGLVEHVLATSQEFTKLPNGFYDLVEKRHEHRN